MRRPHRVYVLQGEVRWSQEPCVFKTVLGSCVSVCLWDPVQRIGGLNHFMLPRAPVESGNPRFGDVAIPLLIDGLRVFGSTELVAKVFGGAALGTAGGVGAANIDLALSLLGEHQIPVAAQRTGGTRGLVIQFHSQRGDVMVSQILGA